MAASAANFWTKQLYFAFSFSLNVLLNQEIR